MGDRSAVGRQDAVSRSQDGDYDPFANRPPGPLTSDLAALIHLLKSAVGNGILFLPNAFKRAGYVMSVSGGVFIGLLCSHTIVMLVRAAQELCVRNRIPTLDFAQTAQLSVEIGPPRFRKYGKIFNVFTNVLVCFVHFQACVIYTLYVASSLQQVIEFYSGLELDVRIYIVALFPILCFLGYTPDLKYLAPFSFIGSFFIFSGICVTYYYLLRDFPDPGRLPLFTAALPVPMYCNLFLYALHNATLCLPLENSMKNPKHLPWLVTASMVINTCMYTLFGFFGYNKYDERTCDTVIKNLPMEDVLAQIVKVTIPLSVLFSFGLAYYVPIIILWPMIATKVSDTELHLNMFRMSGVLGTTLLAIAVPKMIPLLNLLASFSMTSIMLMIPTVIDTATRWERATWGTLIKNGCILLVYSVLTIFGAFEGAWIIITEYSHTKEPGC